MKHKKITGIEALDLVNIHNSIQSLREKAENEFTHTIASRIVLGNMTDDELTIYAIGFLAENIHEEDFQ
tara:strand:+ start:26 stop:232 length:207 start_codon:yes stop_codon:yes gene_type:complete